MKKSKILLSLFAILSLVLVIVGCSGSISAAEAYVTIDINPSIEVVVNEKEEVVYVHALNEDAEVLLVDLDLVGMNVDEAMDLIIEQAILLGYIDTEAAETYVSVSTTSENDLGEKIKTRVKAAINNAFLVRSMMGKARDKQFTEEFIAEAENYGVEPEFLSLAYSVTYVDDEITLEVALEMTRDELIDVLKTARQEAKDVAQAYKQEFLAARAKIGETYIPDIEDLETQIETLEAQIDTTTDDTTELEAQLVQLQTALQALKDTMYTELEKLRAEYQTMTATMLQEYQQIMNQRMSQFEEKVQNWNQNKGSNRGNKSEDEWKDTIRNFQNKNDDEGQNDETDTTE